MAILYILSIGVAQASAEPLKKWTLVDHILTWEDFEGIPDPRDDQQALEEH
jgi:hypothetical protein